MVKPPALAEGSSSFFPFHCSAPLTVAVQHHSFDLAVNSKNIAQVSLFIIATQTLSIAQH